MDRKILDRNIGFLVSDIARLIGVEYNRIMKPMGLTTPQFRMIMQLQREDGVTQSRLANILAVGKVSISGLIDRLEQSGWIERRADPGDRRSKHPGLTSGRRFAAKRGLGLEKGSVSFGSLATSPLASLALWPVREAPVYPGATTVADGPAASPSPAPESPA